MVTRANVCCPLGCFFTRSKVTDTWPSKQPAEDKTGLIVLLEPVEEVDELTGSPAQLALTFFRLTVASQVDVELFGKSI